MDIYRLFTLFISSDSCVFNNLENAHLEHLPTGDEHPGTEEGVSFDGNRVLFRYEKLPTIRNICHRGRVSFDESCRMAGKNKPSHCQPTLCHRERFSFERSWSMFIMIWKMFKMSIFQTELFDCLYRIYTFYFYYFTTILLQTFEDAHSPLCGGTTMLILRPAPGQGTGFGAHGAGGSGTARRNRLKRPNTERFHGTASCAQNRLSAPTGTPQTPKPG